MQYSEMGKTKILVFGANGWIGNKLVNFLNAEPSRTRVEGYESVLSEIRRVRPDIVINAIGKTHGKTCDNIDGCLDEPEETIKSNVLAVASLTKACEKIGCYFIHLSSGCIFNGYPKDKPSGFDESDIPNLVSFYSETKVQGELIAKIYNKALILRLRLPFDGKPNKRNLIDKLVKNLANKYLLDTPNSMTCIDDLLAVIRELIKIRATGIYHVTNPGSLRHIQILRWMRDLGIISAIPENLKLVSPKEFDRLRVTIDRRSNCILDTTKLQKTISLTGFEIRSVEKAMYACLIEYLKHTEILCSD